MTQTVSAKWGGVVRISFDCRAFGRTTTTLLSMSRRTSPTMLLGAFLSCLLVRHVQSSQPSTTQWQSIAAQLDAKQPISHDEAQFPSGWSGKVAGHMPVLSINGTSATVTVDHGMSSAHFIDTIYVRDQSGAVVHMQTFDGSEASAQTTFEIPSSATTLTAYEHCNLHGLWKSALVPLPDAELR